MFRKRSTPPAVPLQDRHPDWPVGRGSYGDPVVHDWGEGARLKVGAFCSIANGVQIFLGGEHRSDWVTTYPFNVLWPQAAGFTGHPKTKGDVVIGNDVWVGADAVILSGVTIGDGAVIGARAVVSRDVEPYQVVAGNPARAVRMRFEPRIVERLLALRWWDWDDARIEARLPLMLNSDIEAFLSACEARPDA
jgi:acetyltransferase-like isoleucine patch superfamily enzyme